MTMNDAKQPQRECLGCMEGVPVVPSCVSDEFVHITSVGRVVCTGLAGILAKKSREIGEISEPLRTNFGADEKVKQSIDTVQVVPSEIVKGMYDVIASGVSRGRYASLAEANEKARELSTQQKALELLLEVGKSQSPTRSLAGEAAQPRFVDGKCRYCGEPEGQHLPDMCGYDKCKGQSCDKWIHRPQNPHQLCDECLLKYIASLEARLAVSTPPAWQTYETDEAVLEYRVQDGVMHVKSFGLKAAALSPAQAAKQCDAVSVESGLRCGLNTHSTRIAHEPAAQAVAEEPPIKHCNHQGVFSPCAGSGCPPAAPEPVAEPPLAHTRSCPLLRTMSDDDCTCGLQYRIALQTERELHNAWRKRAEEAEGELELIKTGERAEKREGR